jgi:peptidoglycan/LPS O-acetylase OafA/YrhL
MGEDPPLTVKNVVLVLVDIFTSFDARALVLLLFLLAVVALLALGWVTYKGVAGLIRDWRQRREKP